MYEWLQSYIAVCEMLQIKPMTALHNNNNNNNNDNNNNDNGLLTVYPPR